MIDRQNDERADEARWLDDLCAIARRRLRDQPVELWLFGSRARGDQRTASDVDLAVDVRGPIPATLLSNLAEAFEESTVPYRVDLLDLRDASATLRARVFAEGRRWIACENESR